MMDADLLMLVLDTDGVFDISPLLETLADGLLENDNVPTKMAALDQHATK